MAGQPDVGTAIASLQTLATQLTTLTSALGTLVTKVTALETQNTALAAQVAALTSGPSGTGAGSTGVGGATGNTLSTAQITALVALVQAANPGKTVTILTRDPYVLVSGVPVVPTANTIQLRPTLGRYIVAAGSVPGSSFNVNYQRSPDNTYPWDQVPYTRVYEEIANCNGVGTEEVVFQDSHLVTVNSGTSVTVNNPDADAQVTLAATYGITYMPYLFTGPAAFGAYAAHCTSPSNTLAMMTAAVNAIVGHFKGLVKGYVIFNEVIQFGGYNSNAFVTGGNGLGTDFTTGAFAQCIQLVHAADPAAEIWLNTNHIETDTTTNGPPDASQWTFYLNQAIGLKTHGGSALTGVSFESHLIASLGANVYTQFAARCNAARAAGLKVLLGEIDVTDDTQTGAGPSGIAARDSTSAAIFANYLTAAFSATVPPACVRPWQWDHGKSWLNSPPSFYPGGSPADRQTITTDGDKFVVSGMTLYAHQLYPTGAALVPSGNTITIPIAPSLSNSIAGGTTVTYTRGLTGGTFAFTGTLTTNGTQNNNATTLSLIATTMSGKVVEGTHGRPCLAFDEVGNVVPAYFAARAALTPFCPGGTFPSVQVVSGAGKTERYYVQAFDTHGALLMPQPTVQLHSSNTGCATVPNNPTMTPDGSIGSFLATVVGNGLTTISATALGITSNLMTLETSSALLTHEPSGMTPVIQWGATTNAPSSVNGSWIQGTDGNGAPLTWNNTSPNTISAVGEQASNLTLSPDGQWVQINYPSTLHGGNSPVRFGPNHFTTRGSGRVYFRWDQMFSATWTDNGNLGCKLFDVTLAVAGEVNHIVATEIDQNHSPTDNSDAFLILALQGPDVPTQNVPQITGSQQYRTIEPNAQLAGPTKGNPHTCEMLIIQDSPAGAGNGSVQFWVDGNPAWGPQIGLNIIGAADSVGWNGPFYDPTYGAGSNNPPPGTPIFQRFRNVYASVG